MFTRRTFLERGGLAAGALLLPREMFAAWSSDPSSTASQPSAAQAPSAALLERARALLRESPFIDTHNDLPSMMLEAGGDLSKFDLSKPQPTLCADVPRLREGCVGAQYWSVYVSSGTQYTHTSLHEAMKEFDIALRIIRSQPAFEQARTADDIERIYRAGRIACLMGVEGGHMMEDSLAALRVFYELGARYMTLTHWDNIAWADAATDRVEHNGLTEFGKKTVREMNRLGMFVDISHVSADTMRDVLSVTRAPVLFSHSSAFAINPHPRNVPDDVLQQVSKNGGVVHVNFIKEFISPQNPAYEKKHKAALDALHGKFESDKEIQKGIEAWEKENPYPRPTIKDMADHIDHIRKVAGIDHIGIGADFYDTGSGSMVEGLDDVTRYPYLFAELLNRGYSDDDIRKIAGRNHLRAMRQMERAAQELRKSQGPILGEGVEKS